MFTEIWNSFTKNLDRSDWQIVLTLDLDLFSMRIEYCEQKALAACLTYKNDFEEIVKPSQSEKSYYQGKYYALCKQDFDDCIIEQNKVR